MELKLSITDDKGFYLTLLIVPYGIETEQRQYG